MQLSLERGACRGEAAGGGVATAILHSIRNPSSYSLMLKLNIQDGSVGRKMGAADWCCRLICSSIDAVEKNEK